MINLQKPLILASNSPRRKQLLTDSGFTFDIDVKPTDESFPTDLPAKDVAAYICEQKAAVFRDISAGRIILTADTVVIAENRILGKPFDAAEAFEMLRLMSGKSHDVVTAVTILTDGQMETISDTATVYFRELADSEISYYIEQCKPFDKAGAYGVQEWIGMTGIERIEGSFYTIMGLPVHIVYQKLKPFFRD
ncbi:nucleoside triphosphate pyrophosphatase [Dyadobacter sp. CY343]|uniref:Maf family protein n=1 Tax=Dyadobacter sp. CY343 TaxID=2907299 RepID=UPI001F3BC1D4|nr:Maf family nucleotide pyrophosphatase [Dyadobacter sp. CY343]MCE7060901.1 Maf family nucleotide pyrophosphatase [Dyadobacter sp. CY343]